MCHRLVDERPALCSQDSLIYFDVGRRGKTLRSPGTIYCSRDTQVSKVGTTTTCELVGIVFLCLMPHFSHVAPAVPSRTLVGRISYLYFTNISRSQQKAQNLLTMQVSKYSDASEDSSTCDTIQHTRLISTAVDDRSPRRCYRACCRALRT